MYSRVGTADCRNWPWANAMDVRAFGGFPSLLLLWWLAEQLESTRSTHIKRYLSYIPAAHLGLDVTAVRFCADVARKVTKIRLL